MRAQIRQLRGRERRADRLIRKLQRDWDGLATHNAFGAILRDPAHIRDPWSTDAFFATGDADVEVILTAAARHDLPRRYGRALDFGCGVGRLSRGLAKCFDEAVGVDISPVMISSARKLNGEIPNCSFEVSADSGLSRFDSVRSISFCACSSCSIFLAVQKPNGTSGSSCALSAQAVW